MKFLKFVANYGRPSGCGGFGPAVDTKPETKSKPPEVKDPRHYVEMIRCRIDGVPATIPGDLTLCGQDYTDLNVEHNGEICQDCVDELRRKGQA